MAYTDFGVNDALAVKTWSKELTVAMRDYLEIAPLFGDDENSVIQVKTETKKGAGDKVTFGLRARLTQAGITESETAEGSGESLSIYSDSVLINERGCVVGSRSENTIDAQRVPFDLRAQCKDAAAEWWGDRWSKAFFNHMCGYTPANTVSTTTGPKFTGLNTVTAHTSGRRIFAGTVSDDQSLGTGDTFTLALVDQAKELAMVGDNMVRPIRINGAPKYIMYLHPFQVTSLRTASGAGSWREIQLAALAAAKDTNNPIYSGALGEYNGVILRSCQDVTQGVNSSTGAAVTTVRRAVLLGAQSAVAAFGQNNSQSKYRWNEELMDHRRRLEVAAFSICGLKKTVFNSADFGAVTVSSYAIAST